MEALSLLFILPISISFKSELVCLHTYLLVGLMNALRVLLVSENDDSANLTGCGVEVSARSAGVAVGMV